MGSIFTILAANTAPTVPDISATNSTLVTATAVESIPVVTATSSTEEEKETKNEQVETSPNALPLTTEAESKVDVEASTLLSVASEQRKADESPNLVAKTEPVLEEKTSSSQQTSPLLLAEPEHAQVDLSPEEVVPSLAEEKSVNTQEEEIFPTLDVNTRLQPVLDTIDELKVVSSPVRETLSPAKLHIASPKLVPLQGLRERDGSTYHKIVQALNPPVCTSLNTLPENELTSRWLDDQQIPYKVENGCYILDKPSS